MWLNKLSILLFVCSIIACSSSKKSGGEQVIKENVDYTGAPTTIYKTTKDYSKNVPITLSDDKSKIVSYPAPSDIYYKGELSYPIELANYYLLDNRGVSINTAFLKYTYDEYSKLKEVPDLKTLYNLIIDKNPITEMYNCGNRYRFKDEVQELNSVIVNQKLNSFKKVK